MIRQKFLISRILPAIVFVMATAAVVSADNRKWDLIVNDGLHDPNSPAVGVLQEPGEALSALPPDAHDAGNKVNWPKAIENGYINPKTSRDGKYKMKVLDLDILLTSTREMPMVLFPHIKHTVWLDCANCHEKIFKMKAGATPINMYKILMGEYCGLCHGAVAFPLTQCLRCHSVRREHESVQHQVD